METSVSKIPKRIIQTWKTEELKKEARILVEKLKSNNPDFEYMFFTDNDIDVFIKKEYPKYYDLYCNFEYTIQKIDFFRYLAIYHYGGFYFDLDMDIDKSLIPLCDYDCVFPKEYGDDKNCKGVNFENLGITVLLGNYAFGASKGNAFLKSCVEHIYNKTIQLSSIPNNNDRYSSYTPNTMSQYIKVESYIDHVLYTTGPVLISKSYAEYENKQDIYVIEPVPFKKYAFGNYGTHLAVGTWKHVECMDQYTENKTLIPKQIHQIWIGERMQPYSNINSWKKEYISNNSDWEYTLWDEEKIKKLWYAYRNDDLICCAKYIYDVEETLSGKVDILKLVLLYCYGGIYIDTNCVWTTNANVNASLNSILNESQNRFFASYESHTSDIISNRVLGSPSKDSNLKMFLDKLRENRDIFLQARLKYSARHIIRTIFFDNLNKSNITLFPCDYFYSIPENMNTTEKQSYMIYNNAIPRNENVKGRLLFSCTTFISNEKKYNILLRTLDTFIKFNKNHLYLIDDYLIVLEYSSLNRHYINELELKYPMMTFIDKKEYQKGQSFSLNMIIDKLEHYEFWMHWEDSWYSIGPVLQEAYNIITTTDISHYSLTQREIIYTMPVVENNHIHCKLINNEIKKMQPSVQLIELFKYWQMNDMDWSVWKDVGWWPFFSLTPSINKVSDILNVGYFSIESNKWPFQFEFEWALRWIKQKNIVIGINKDIKVVRDNDKHVSTYTMDNYKRWELKLAKREKKETYNREVPYYTLKSDKKKIILFWYPSRSSSKIKKLIYSIEEGMEYRGHHIHQDIGEYNKNKYFVEITPETLNKFSSYKKILVKNDDNINNSDTFTIPPQWIDETVSIDDIDNI